MLSYHNLNLKEAPMPVKSLSSRIKKEIWTNMLINLRKRMYNQKLLSRKLKKIQEDLFDFLTEVK